jgi:hypothetical protein
VEGRGRCGSAGDRNRGAFTVTTDVQLERKRWRAAYPDDFDDGFAHGFFGRAQSDRDPSGGNYPLGFHAWSTNRKDAWFSGFNLGYVKRLQTDCKIGVHRFEQRLMNV